MFCFYCAAKDNDFLPRSKVLTVERESSKHMLSADRTKSGVNSRQLQQVQVSKLKDQ